ncbi:tripartite tricarboxylate transporter substrate binding protein [Clostridium sp. AM58-1XD]|uniref:Bug family tripartite tricarboxylate transporter substrate binding protein n=1 Tax=Clostridium sp. AM58-1XD TaxID=2292307 RepID=UPI000E50B2F1|nr:tripartite tricarboxylate transporter substrate binding protein [Clostridium sp. AM58-1XD]RGZ01202.1 tripartite tricarboxylate transporter substrate binding protein [Clostridium sp. AM58-1XD]
MKLSAKNIITFAAAFGFTLCLAACGAKQGTEGADKKAMDFPKKPVTVVVPYGAGGGNDTVARMLASVSDQYLGQKLVVENQGGGNTIPGSASVAKADPDGYTILLNNNTSITAVTQVYEAGFDPREDLIPFATPGTYSNVICAGPAAPAKTAEEFIAYCKEHPGEVTISCAGYADATGLTVFRMMDAMGIECQVIPFTSGSEQISNLLGGHVMYSSVAGGNVVKHAQEGTVVPIIETCGIEDNSYKVPTLADLGYEEALTPICRMFYAPKGTPDEVLDILAAAFEKMFQDEEMQKMFGEIYEPLDHSSVDRKQLTEDHLNDYEDFGTIITELDLKSKV